MAMMTRVFAIGVAALLAMAGPAAAAFPERPVRMVVPYGPGGTGDVIARSVAQKLEQAWGQPVVVENRPGAGGAIGARAVASSPPDGYTLLIGNTSTLAVIPAVSKSAGYDPVKDFVPIFKITEGFQILVVDVNSPWKTLKDFIADAKANPGKINYASQGIGTTSHLTAALFETRTGVKLVHVPYKGTAPALNDIIAGNVDMIFMELASAIKLHQAGKARILAVATNQRIPNLPDIPTFAELGVKDFESGTWNAIVAPPGTPKAIVAKLNAAVEDVLKGAHAQEIFHKINLHAASGTPAEAKKFINEQTALWGGVIKAAGVKPH